MCTRHYKHTHTNYNPLSSLDTDLQVLLDSRLKHPRTFLNAKISKYLNISKLRNKLLDLWKFCHVLIKYFVISETKFLKSFPSAQFKPADYEIGTRRDKDWNVDGIIVDVWKGVICKRLKEFETTLS